ncbi:bifunctional biotin--[acetyl-CoA-carboxylase] ligase/biotin operon repressor BirA [Pseudomonas oligotrophica]|uniref:bifunctional biotin--[acetyl-CoA-carboxylase] ligase/biotin operon repressor BirA n=1 Tax=Pseudomonas oligotrophica TaxID=2912055 RepID=UPI001F02C543|nr:bifunctional biotin--[acetyl-CoA-carboxylase] ligase/biotin operon repressor BirA [Pseudomonas oligotrophica]MCF7203853.1 bifunctional biotin--[acetyl-CoA-carboxylase] ligase/biotin operon repressor BirA [Pseudomonas oligotrophica]
MQRVLELLQDGCFHSGEELGAVFGVTRTAVWKHLKKLESESGIVVHRVPGKGYRLASPLSLLRASPLEAGFKAMGWVLHCHDRIDSTNAEALRLLAAGGDAPLVVLTEAQISGRGRRGRAWVSPYGDNLYFSLGCRIVGGFSRLAGLSLIVGLAVVRAIQAQGFADVGVKWPNDVYLAGKKVAGILVEIAGDPADACDVAIGIGINVNMTGTEACIDQPWTSLRLRSGALVDRTNFALGVGSALERYLARFLAEGFAGLRGEWESCHLWQGRECVLGTPTQGIQGTVLGVDSQGGLRLRVDGKEEVFSGGELSLRRVHDS